MTGTEILGHCIAKYLDADGSVKIKEFRSGRSARRFLDRGLNAGTILGELSLTDYITAVLGDVR